MSEEFLYTSKCRCKQKDGKWYVESSDPDNETKIQILKSNSKKQSHFSK